MTTIRQNKHLMRIVAFTLLFAMLACLLPAGRQEAAAATNLNNPRTGADGTVTWDCVWFGHYPQSSDGKGGFSNDPIKWRVLSVEGNEALLLADKCLDAGAYNETYEDVTWETSTVRNWLNGSGSDNFLGKAFNDAEHNAIYEKTIQNPNNPGWGTMGGNVTNDKVLFLSIDDVVNPAYGFPSDYSDWSKTRRAVNTDYAKSRGAWTSSSSESAGNGCWWLRSPGSNTHYAAFVGENGEVDSNGNLVTNMSPAVPRTYYAVRPALHLDLSSNCWSYAGTVSSDGTVSENFSSDTIEIPRDVWKMENPSGRTIPLEFYKRFFESAQAEKLYKKNYSYQGLCTAFAATAIMLNDGMVSVNSFGSNYDFVNKLNYGDASSQLVDGTTNLTVSDWIEYTFLYSLTKEYQKRYTENRIMEINPVSEFNYRKCIDCIKSSIDNRTYCIIGIRSMIGLSTYGHALLPIKYEEDNQGIKINVYDCNYPQDSERYLYIKKVLGIYDAWEYQSGNRVYASGTLASSLTALNISSDICKWLKTGGITILPAKKLPSVSIKSVASSQLRLVSSNKPDLALKVGDQSVSVKDESSDDIDVLTPIVAPTNGSKNNTDSYLYWTSDEDISYQATTQDIFSVTDDTNSIEFILPKDAMIDVGKETNSGKTVTVSGVEDEKVTLKYSDTSNEKKKEYSIIGTAEDKIKLLLQDDKINASGFTFGKITTNVEGEKKEQEFSNNNNGQIIIWQEDNTSVIQSGSNPSTDPEKPSTDPTESSTASIKPTEQPDTPSNDSTTLTEPVPPTVQPTEEVSPIGPTTPADPSDKPEEPSTDQTSPTQNPTPATPGKPPAKGTTITDTKSKADYTITKTGKTGGTVTYIKPTKRNITSVIAPSTIAIGGITYKVTAIAPNAFKNCKWLKKITIGNNIRTIGKSAFSGCSKLRTVVFGKNVTVIGDQAFYKCTALTKIVIPSKVVKIGKKAFFACKKLKDITIKTKKLTSKRIGASAFKGTSAKAVVKTPKGKARVYKKLLQTKGLSKKARVK